MNAHMPRGMFIIFFDIYKAHGPSIGQNIENQGCPKKIQDIC